MFRCHACPDWPGSVDQTTYRSWFEVVNPYAWVVFGVDDFGNLMYYCWWQYELPGGGDPGMVELGSVGKAQGKDGVVLGEDVGLKAPTTGRDDEKGVLL
ncbi:hypothetical protein L1887_32673 [Cichorium endivia]|nr:hypothetical protein L1887_32673 [Cichorium endivia]